MMTKIDLIMVSAGSQGPSDKAHIPLGLLYVGSALERHGYDVKIWHLLPEELDPVLPEMTKRKPLWVGLSVLSGMTTYYAAQFSKRFREVMPETPIVWGGHHATATPNECLKEPFIDYVIHGEGEETAVELSNALRANTDISEILGLAYKTPAGEPRVNASRPFVEDIDKHELHWELIDIQQYMHCNTQGKIPVSFYSSRGCPYQCTFCATPMYTGKTFRSHSPDFVVRNLEYLKDKYGFNSVFFSDDNFMIDSKRGMEIIHRLVSKGISVDTLDVRLNQLNDDMLREFKEHDVNGVFFGYESGNERVLRLMNKGIDLDQMKSKVQLLNKHGITVWASGIIGVPTETREEIYDTIDFSMWLRDNLPEGSTVSVFRYMPLPKTKLLELAIQEGFPYPENTQEWRKIDPIGSSYRMKSWLPWLTQEDEVFFSLIQELSRCKMLNYVHNRSLPVNMINNMFVSRIRSRVTSRHLKWDAELRLFEWMRGAYSRLKYGKNFHLKSEAIDR